MALDEKYRMMLARADRALGNNSPVEAVKKVRAIIGPRNIPQSELEAQHALEALRRGEKPTPAQVAALEIVVRLMRPVVLSRDGMLGDLPETPNKDLQPTALKDAWSTFRTTVHPFIGSIGRIEDASNRHVGTGFVAGRDVIATNRHVLAVLSTGSEVLVPGSARIVFKQEFRARDQPSDIVAIEGVAAIHLTLDVVLLKIDAGGRQPVRFCSRLPAVGEAVATVGYPGNDEANNPLFLTSVFDGRFGVRSAAVGEALDGTAASNIFHDCSTTQGNSGSPVFLISTGEVAGIHRSGYFMYRNEAVSADEIGRLLP